MRTLSVIGLLFVIAPSAFAQGDVNDATEAAMKAAAAKVAPCVVKIETTGGTEVVGGPSVRAGGTRKGVGPTTGLVVGADGYVVTSSFNFSNKPTDVFVTIPGRETRLVAKVVAHDQTRMLSLLKVEAKDLPVPTAYPKADFKVGQWTIALGRALNPDAGAPPSASIGIVSALGRIQGKCVQTDAKISPVNYGGPLVAIDGRVIGVLVPASPRGETDTAGIEWYDSGIGFAVPLEDVFAVLPQFKKGKDLRRGLLGVTFQNAREPYFDPPKIENVSPDSAAAKLGLKTGDQIVKVDGKPVLHITGLQYLLGPKYDGDKISLTVLRDKKEVSFPDVTLTASASSFAAPYLGILPMRDDPELGVAVRYVYPGSPADKAGIKTGDRIMKAQPPKAFRLPDNDGAVSFQGRQGLARLVQLHQPGQTMELQVKRKDGGKVDTVQATLVAVPDVLPDALPLPSSVGKALDKPKVPTGGRQPTRPTPVEKKPGDKPKPAAGDKKPDGKKPADKKDEAKKVETGLLKLTNPTLGREYWVYVPTTYKPGIAHGIILWLHDAGKGGKDADDVVKIWRDFCETYNYILVGPKSQNPDGWVASETEAVIQDLKDVLGRYTVDRSRVIAHGMGSGGAMGYYLGFHARDIIRGVAVSGAVPGTQPKDNTPGQPLNFFLVVGDKNPNLKEIGEGLAKLKEKKFPVIYREIKDFGKEYLTDVVLAELQRWLDALDRI
ncbi:MAG TPA: PDZ domain-containing protein [Fimbriiglobus sp.]|jgi:S1-C subfamily serine protease